MDSITIDSTRVSPRIAELVTAEFTARGIQIQSDARVIIVLFPMHTPRVTPADPGQYHSRDNVLWVGIRSTCNVNTMPSRLQPTDYVHSQWTGGVPALYQILITVYTDSIAPVLHACSQNHYTFADISANLRRVI